MPYANQVTEKAPPAFRTARFLIGTTAILIAPTNPLRRSLLIQNLSTSDIRIGESSTQSAIGPKIPGGTNAALTLYAQAEVYAVAAADNAELVILEEYLEDNNG